MSVPQAILDGQPALSEWAILHGYRGSIAHGTYEPATEPTSIDDKDTVALCVPPREHYIGLKEFGSRGTKEIKQGEWDIVIYEVRKALRMLIKGNPNLLALLWLPDNLYIECTAAGALLLENRSLFATRQVYHSFAGYASGQLYKMEHGAFKGYMGDKRKALVDQYGYDTKNAAHLIRLLRQAAEFLSSGELTVQRPDAPELLQVKHGAWPLEKVKAEAERLFRRAEEAYDRSVLPVVPDVEAVNRLCVQIIAAEIFP